MIQDSDLVLRFCKDVESRSQTVVHITMISSTLPFAFIFIFQFLIFMFINLMSLYWKVRMYISHSVVFHVKLLYMLILLASLLHWLLSCHINNI